MLLPNTRVRGEAPGELGAPQHVDAHGVRDELFPTLASPCSACCKICLSSEQKLEPGGAAV